MNRILAAAFSMALIPFALTFAKAEDESFDPYMPPATSTATVANLDLDKELSELDELMDEQQETYQKSAQGEKKDEKAQKKDQKQQSTDTTQAKKEQPDS